MLIARLGREQRVFPVGQPVRVGRDPTPELVSLSPLVSRGVHGLITSDENGAVYTDQSRRGTFLSGKRLRGPLRITESLTLRLGDPATGEELAVTPPFSGARLERNRDRRLWYRRAGLAALLVGLAAVGGTVAGADRRAARADRAANRDLPHPALRRSQPEPDRPGGRGFRRRFRAGWSAVSRTHLDGRPVDDRHLDERIRRIMLEAIDAGGFE